MPTGYNDFAVLIPAAGFSSRMESFKPLLPLGNESFLTHIANLWRSCGVWQIATVSGHRAEELEAEALHTSLCCIRNPRPEDGMFSSIRLGLDHLYHNSRASWFALHPVDIPLVKAETVQALLLMARSLNGGVLYPSCKHRKGHPPLIHRNLIPHILSWNGDMGLRGALKGAAAQYLNINDTAVLADMDYPHDYARALRIFHAGNFVPLETCHAH